MSLDVLQAATDRVRVMRRWVVILGCLLAVAGLGVTIFLATGPHTAEGKAIAYIRNTTDQNAYLPDDGALATRMHDACKALGNYGVGTAIANLKDDVYARYPSVDRSTRDYALANHIYYGGGLQMVLSDMEIHDGAVTMHAAITAYCSNFSDGLPALDEVMSLYHH
jgi:hypothetical protein